MITSDYKDFDGFKLQFEESCPEEERKYYMKIFPRVDDVAKDRIHCTTCDLHVGTAPISEKIIRTHQILNVTQCNKCFAFYNSGEFGKGEDGSEYYCRWCGQGGEVFCCSTCPFVFCNKCIRDNLTQSYIKEIESNDDWSCFVCNKEILKRLRAQHWALRNFMNKQLEKIQSVNINSEEELNNMLNDDSATCCPRKKRKSVIKPSPAPIKRPSMNGGGSIIGQPPAKKQQIIAPTKPLKIPINSNYHLTKPGPKPTPSGPPARKNNDSIVCTPDILGMFKDKNKPTTSNVPPPLIMRQNQARPIRPTGGTPTNPIFHTVNGFQIDLNQASRQEIFRLPNGKLIQVRKQTNSQQQNPRIPMQPQRPQFTIRPTQPMMHQSRMIRPPPTGGVPQLRPVRAPLPQRSTPISSAAQTSGNASTIFTQQNGSISVARAPQPDTPFGKAKTAFEDKIINGLEICQHTINKMITLTNSTSFKTSRNFSDLKELYIHLQYLFTYTSGKIKTLQDNLVNGMEELAKHDVALKEKNEDGELEIVEQKQEVIEVLSDDEDSSISKKESQPSTSIAAETTEVVTENDNIQQEIMANLVDTMQNSISRFVPLPEILTNNVAQIEDKKLKNKTVVKVERLEDSKSAVIKQYLIAIQQRQQQRCESESRESSPMDLFCPEVVMEEENFHGTSKEKDVQDTEKVQSIENIEEEQSEQNTEKQLSEDAKEVTNETVEKLIENELSKEVVEIPSDDEIDKDETVKINNEVLLEKEGEVIQSEVRKEQPESSIIAISSEESVNTQDATENEEQMLNADDIPTDNVLDVEKDLLDNLINSLEEPLAPIELENFS
ncbi:hypothetical protein PVAND_003699 [Polypedilum vanderplanki]|uniref:PHD-type domain-containing protein n=1 Tax=Polypedilum vanderplanki TaxID=319348 RepID=A0A9J6BUU7_POLVA|nr:hypothetical protein PVAND_003699 [Polypedilum vanderplanki]